MEALQLGAVQMLAPSLAKFGPLGVQRVRGLRPALHLRRLPGAAQGDRGPGRQGAVRQAGAQGHHGLAYWDNGFKVMSANKPIARPADFKGQKMRIQSSKVLEAQMRALGATAAGDGVLRGLPGAADRRGRRHRESAVELLHPEDARGAEVRQPHRPRLPGLRRHRQQEVLGRPARRHPRHAREARWRTRPSSPTTSPRRKTTTGARRRSRAAGKTQIFTPHPPTRSASEEGPAQGARADERPHRQGPDRVDLQGDGLQALAE